MNELSPQSEQPAVRWGAATDVGLVRIGNEDNYVAEPMVFAVADGMGGHQAGEVASDIAARIMRDRLALGASNVGVVVASVVEANASIYQAAHASADHHGMGTTLTAMVVLRADTTGDAARFALVNVGDSRTYLLRNGELHRATVDHSYVQELVNTGHISEDEARSHPRRNIVTRALGIEPTVRVDTWLVPMVNGDRFILCSDGLVDEVHDNDIASIAIGEANPQLAAEQLIAKAKANGGRDNVTVVVVDVLQGVASTSAAAELESEPGWPGSDSTTTMIDADAASGGSGGSLFAPVDTEAIAGQITEPNTTQTSSSWSTKRFLKLLGAAALLTVVATLIAVAVHNSNTDAPAPKPTAPATVPATAPSTSSTTAPSTTTPSTTLPPASSVTLVTSISSP